jgi:hypothetical protein
MSKQFWRTIQTVIGLAILVFIGLRLANDWAQVSSEPIKWELRWEFIIASLLVTWVMYGLLIWGWRSVLHGWRQYIRAVDAARIWCLSSLGKYIPGKVWSIAGMAAMAERQGVSGVAAISSAVIMQLVSLATGAVVALMFTGTVVLDRILAPYTPYGSVLAFAGAGFALLCSVALTLPSLTRRLGHLIGKPDSVQPVEPGALAGALFVNFLAWGGYGLAFQLLVLGTIPSLELTWTTATGAFAASYVIGYLALVVPGGIGVREGVLVLLLQGTLGGLGPAVALAAASRITLTINEIGAAVPFLLMRRPSRDDA